MKKVRLGMEESVASTSVVKSGQLEKCKESGIEGTQEKKVCVQELQGGKESASGLCVVVVCFCVFVKNN